MGKRRFKVRSGSALTRRRLALGKTRQEIAASADIAPQHLCRLENGVREYVNLETANGLARALKVKREEIIEVVA